MVLEARGHQWTREAPLSGQNSGLCFRIKNRRKSLVANGDEFFGGTASTEMGNDIPLENALAMCEAAGECTFQSNPRRDNR